MTETGLFPTDSSAIFMDPIVILQDFTSAVLLGSFAESILLRP
jgi:hypothetical protein